ncbi:MAG: peroxiredoxin [Bacteroidetes bacterium]|nr:peroxiredoxin [Rhodothermia bacterium]MCS7154387.1 peroxiredoxin [Bacteroidota bacterium]MCX7907632.1 peroxiredoxin [Bacteroidota bacterium]MDW8137761.1 peroxiredoxin [Bacteroidota bacterium]MDW8286388.1 peroxiredoxin [Bacteroidota bacterium]
MVHVLLVFALTLWPGSDKKPKVGDPAPDFEAPATSGKTIRLRDLKGSWVVLYFYPKAFTPGCTAQSCALRDGYAEIQKLGAVILGVSLDDLETQKRFKAEHRLPFELLSDVDKKIAGAYGVLAPMGLFAQRKTFIIDPEGRIAYVFDKVDAAKHDQEVRQVLAQLVGRS